MTNNLIDDLMQDDADKPAQSGDFYANDVQAAAMADQNINPDTLKTDEEEPVTSGDMSIGDLDQDPELLQGTESSIDEETMPGSDNVSDQ